MQEDVLSLVEIVRRIEDCATEPFLCRCDDNELYIVKGMPILPRRELIAEWVSAKLASFLKLSIPNSRIVYVDSAFTEFQPEWKRDLEEGYAFATQYIQNSFPITFSQAHQRVPETTQKFIYLFDMWINNADRTLAPSGLGNVNMLFNLLNDKYYLIDHNLAFDNDGHQIEFNSHVYCPTHRTWDFDWVDQDEHEEQIANAMVFFEEVVSDIPDEWMLEDPVEHTAYINFMRETLRRVTDIRFWSNLS
ncbi:HipA family kinase [Hafnia alvei]|uniref:HipA family kinase n=1 Tax=Hafnia alvei TaxID=569 RepID=UPI0010351ACD|nr:HipA family kinase [Hafnia alvei]TBM14389.1 hypothetical protein EYY83_12185 [Hafnia alvei]